MCVLLHLLICTVLGAHIIVVEALYKFIIIIKFIIISKEFKSAHSLRFYN